MTTFLFLLHADPAVLASWSPAEMTAVKGRYARWRDDMIAQGRVLGGNKLQDGNGRVIRGRGVTDGPYAELKEVVGGLFIVQAADYDDALALARTCPHLEYGTLEIREVVQ